MNVFDGGLSDSEVGEGSQASQLIHAALQTSLNPSEIQDKSIAASPILIDSFPSSKSSDSPSVHQYHFHGLAETQTQTQLVDEEGNAGSGNDSSISPEGSQKENVQIGVEGRKGKDTKRTETQVEKNPGRFTKTKLTSTKPVPTVTFQSPFKRPLTPSATRAEMAQQRSKTNLVPSRQRNSRSSSPDFSQDSFAQADSQLSQEKFLTTSKKFTMPLADLAREPNLPVEDDSSVDISMRSTTATASYTSRMVVGDDRPPVILVPATPSQSSNSDNSREEGSVEMRPPPHPDDSFEHLRRNTRMVLDSESSKGSQHSQGYDNQDEVAEAQNLYSKEDSSNEPGDTHMNDVSSFQDTQQATQIATQTEPRHNLQAAQQSDVSTTCQSTLPSTHTGPRSLLSSMDPQKRNRYLHLLPQTSNSPISPQPQQFPAGRSGSTDIWQETQLSETEHSILPPARLLPQKTISSPRKASPKKASPKRPPHPQPPPSMGDAMDIVPDSEPMREPPASSDMNEGECSFEFHNVPARLKQTSPVKKYSKPVDDSEGTEDEDMQPGKRVMQKQEEEEDVEEENDREENMTDDDDDDEPLSARVRKRKRTTSGNSGKMKASTHIYSSKNKGLKKTNGTKHQPLKSTSRETSKAKGKKNSTQVTAMPSSRDIPVPSSVPEQDHAPSVRTRKPSARALAGIKERPIQVVGTRGSSKASLRAASVATSSRSHSSGVRQESSPDEMDMISDSERATEPIDEEEEDEDEDYMEPEVEEHNLKRKRGRLPKHATKSSNALTTPVTRHTKRLKSAGSTISRANATRVYALWEKSQLYYSGIIYERLVNDTYSVKFDDGYEGIVTKDNMRAFDLRVGDLVRIPKKHKDCRVAKVNSRTMSVHVEVGGQLEEHHIRTISITLKAILNDWQDRTLDNCSIIPVLHSLMETKPIPSPSRSATSFQAVKARSKFLPKVGLIVTLNGMATKDGWKRSDIMSAIRGIGGVVMDDLTNYIKMDGKHCGSGNRWVINRDEVEWIARPSEIQRVFLLADDCNLKPKYLMALALGIPCLSIKWLHDSLEANRELDWTSYMLPRGRSTLLNVVPSQQVDLNWGESFDHLQNIILNPAALKIFDERSVLCVGTDMTPQQLKNKRVTEDRAQEAINYIGRIILAMGARRVEAVHDVSSASQPLSQYDFLVIREKEHYTRSYMQVDTVDWNWVKESLIMSRTLPLPSWEIEDASECSQSL